MRKKFYKISSIVLSIICIILSIFIIYRNVFAQKKDSFYNDLNTKIISEVDYLDSTVIEGLNKLNNISIVRYKVNTKTINKPDTGDNKDSENQNSENKKDESTQQKKSENQLNVSQVSSNNSLTETEKKEINWDEITYIYENIYSIWPTIELDLKKLGMKDELVNSFNLDLNGIAQSINNKDKKSALVNFYNLYSQLPNYLSAVTDDESLLLIYKCKSEILNSYVLADEENKWREMSESTTKSKSILKQMIDELDENDTKKSSLERTYSIVNNLDNSTILNDKNIFYMQYKNAIQALETI